MSGPDLKLSVVFVPVRLCVAYPREISFLLPFKVFSIRLDFMHCHQQESCSGLGSRIIHLFILSSKAIYKSVFSIYSQVWLELPGNCAGEVHLSLRFYIT